MSTWFGTMFELPIQKKSAWLECARAPNDTFGIGKNEKIFTDPNKLCMNSDSKSAVSEIGKKTGPVSPFFPIYIKFYYGKKFPL